MTEMLACFPVVRLFLGHLNGTPLKIHILNPKKSHESSTSDSFHFPVQRGMNFRAVHVSQDRSTPCIGDGKPPTFNRESL